MKTKEFIKRVEELGYETIECNYWIDVKHTSWGLKATVFTESSRLSLITNDMNLIKLCIEYAETPLEEREEEKKYFVIIPDIKNTHSHAYGLVRHGDSMGIGHAHRSWLEREYSFTEAEIKRNHEYLWQFAKEVTE